MKSPVPDNTHDFLPVQEMVREECTLKDVMSFIETALFDVMDDKQLKTTGAHYVLANRGGQTALLLQDMKQEVAREMKCLQNNFRAQPFGIEDGQEPDLMVMHSIPSLPKYLVPLLDQIRHREC